MYHFKKSIYEKAVYFYSFFFHSESLISSHFAYDFTALFMESWVMFGNNNQRFETTGSLFQHHPEKRNIRVVVGTTPYIFHHQG